MWSALGNAFECLSRFSDAIRCYLRAEGNGDNEGVSLLRLARLFEKRQDQDMAAKYYRKVLKRYEETHGLSETIQWDDQDNNNNNNNNNDNTSSLNVSSASALSTNSSNNNNHNNNDAAAAASASSASSNTSILIPTQEVIDSLLYLCEYYKNIQNKLNVAEQICIRLLDYG